MGTAKHIGRIGALAIALGVGTFRSIATRMSVSIGASALVVTAAVAAAPISSVSPAVKLSADSTALVLCTTTCPTPDATYVNAVRDQYIAPTHPGQKIDYVPVTTPEEAWPIAGISRLLGLVVADPTIWGPGGPGWPDEPWWKLSGLFDLTPDQSVQAGAADLERAMAEHGNDHLVIFGYSQSANLANKEKRKLAAQYPPGTTAPDINFVFIGFPNLPNGGLAARFPGLNTVILGTFDGPESTDTQFHTDVITRQYDGAADFPLYPLNVIADLNAVLGFFYVHTNYLDAVSLPADPQTSPAYQGTHGDSSYYFFPTQDLPLFDPLRQLGVPEPLIDVVEPTFRVLVELGYDRSIPPWQPTPARVIPTTLNPVKVTTDLVNAIGEGINNVLGAFGAPSRKSTPAAVTLAAPAAEIAGADLPPQVTSTGTPTQSAQVTSTTAAIGSRRLSTDTEQGTALKNASAIAKVTLALKPTLPAGRAMTPRPAVREPVGEPGSQLRGLAPRGNGGPKTLATVFGGPKAPTGKRSSTASSSAASSSKGSSSSGGSSGGGDPSSSGSRQPSAAPPRIQTHSPAAEKERR